MNKGHPLIVLVLCTMLIGWMIPAQTYAVTCPSIKYKQTFTNASKDKNVSRTFRYKLTPEGNSPLPAGSSGGSYYLSYTGNVHGVINLEIPFSSTGDYYYKLTRVLSNPERYVYSPEYFRLMFKVTSGSSGLEVRAINVMNPQGEKYGELPLDITYVGEGGDDDDDGGGGGGGTVNPPAPEEPPADEQDPDDTVVPDDDPDDHGGSGRKSSGEPRTFTERVREALENIIDQLTPGHPWVGEENEWALLNLVFMIITAILAITNGALFYKRPRDDDDYFYSDTDEEVDWKERYERHGKMRIAAAVVGVASVILFFITEDLSTNWVWTDKWTIWMFILLAADIVLAVLSRKKEKALYDDEGGDGPGDI